MLYINFSPPTCLLQIITFFRGVSAKEYVIVIFQFTYAVLKCIITINIIMWVLWLL